MKRMLRLCLYTMMLGTALLGCQQGVTDVGNPTISAPVPTDNHNDPSPSSPAPSQVGPPTIADLIGTYAISTTQSACEFPQNETPRIILGSVSNQIILLNFLSYSPDTLVTGAMYQEGKFTIVDASAKVSCSGAATSASGLQIAITCTVGEPATACSSVFTKSES